MAASRTAALMAEISAHTLRLSAAQAAVEKRGGHSPAGPLYQWSARLDLHAMRRRFEAGDSYALMLAIRVCANHDLAMPDWLAHAYIRAFDNVHGFRTNSWDDAFGRPIPKGAQATRLREKRTKSVQVWNEVNRRHAAGERITDELMRDVGRQLALGRTRTWEFYNDWRRRCGRSTSRKS